MTPCGMNQVTPTMIRNGQMAVGDKIIFEETSEAAAGSVEASAKADKASKAANAAEAAEASGDVNTVVAPSGTSAPEVAETAAAVEVAAVASTVVFAAPSAASAPDPDALSYGEGTVTKNPANSQGYQSVGLPPSWPNTSGQIAYPSEDRNQISYGRMTDYFQGAINGDESSSSPTFTVPSNPMTPPEYTQTLDYDSIQYMNGFLRTQIGRFIRFEQLVGTNIVEDRSGFLVGVSNNYVILQEIGTGNIMTFDTFSIKFVYIYYEDFEVARGATSAY